VNAEQKRKFLEAVDEVERREGTDAPLSPKAVVGLFLAYFPALWEELKEPLAEDQARQLIAARQGIALRSRRRTSTEQMTLALPGMERIQIPAKIRIPPVLKKGTAPKGHYGYHWGKPLEVPVREFGRYLTREQQRLKTASLRQKEKLKPLRELYSIARAGAQGKLSMLMRDALATQAAKRKAKSAGFGSGWLFTETEAVE
jgi:hypothetical protein